MSRPVCHHGPGGQRLTGRRHDGPHEQCEPCQHPHCAVCGARHTDDAHPQTCLDCVASVRVDLSAIVTLIAHLPGQAAHGGRDGRLEAARPIPGGDATVLLAGGSNTTTSSPDESPADPIPPLLLLASWEDDWRRQLGQPAGPRATIDRTIRYLAGHLPLAAQRLDVFPDFASDLRQLRGRLEDVVHAGERDDTTAAPCFDCGGQIVRRITRKGRSDAYTCRRCSRGYDVVSYWLAVRSAAEGAQTGERVGATGDGGGVRAPAC